MFRKPDHAFLQPTHANVHQYQLYEILMSSLHCISAADFRPRGCCNRPRTLPDEADVQTKETGLSRPQDGEKQFQRLTGYCIHTIRAHHYH